MKVYEAEKVISLWKKYHHYIAVKAEHFDYELKRLPTVEAEPVIRCKDCKYNNGGRCSWHGGAGYKWIVDDDDYCSCAEREEG